MLPINLFKGESPRWCRSQNRSVPPLDPGEPLGNKVIIFNKVPGRRTIRGTAPHKTQRGRKRKGRVESFLVQMSGAWSGFRELDRLQRQGVGEMAGNKMFIA